jgi:hypothetical protein
MARQTLAENQAGNYTANGTAKSNNAKANENFEEIYNALPTPEPRYLTLVCPLTADATNVVYGALPLAADVSEVSLSTNAAITGTVSVPVQRGDGVGSFGGLLFAAPIDSSELTGSLVAQDLTETAATLEFAAGQIIKLSVVAAEGATGGPVVARIEYELAE